MSGVVVCLLVFLSFLSCKHFELNLLYVKSVIWMKINWLIYFMCPYVTWWPQMTWSICGSDQCGTFVFLITHTRMFYLQEISVLWPDVFCSSCCGEKGSITRRKNAVWRCVRSQSEQPFRTSTVWIVQQVFFTRSFSWAESLSAAYTSGRLFCRIRGGRVSLWLMSSHWKRSETRWRAADRRRTGCRSKGPIPQF